jgi:branched-chain amino acid transport system permease protein
VDRGVTVRSQDVFVLASGRDLAWVLLPRVVPLVLLLGFPLLGPWLSPYAQTVVLNTLVVALLALSWDLLASAGLVSLGQAFFFGLGGYAAGWLDARLGLTMWIALPLATLIGAVISTALLYPLLRLRGIYFGMITFALPLLLMRVVETTGILGGTEGLSGLTPFPGRTLELYLAILVTLGVLVGFRRLAGSDYGLLFKAIRDNDRAVIASGFDLARRRGQVVFIAALPAAFAGAFVTHRYQFVGMPAFAMDYSILPLTAAVIGGPGTFLGSVVGAFLLVPLSEALREFGALRVVVYSVMLLAFTVGLPEGLFAFAARKWSQFERVVPVEEANRGP